MSTSGERRSDHIDSNNNAGPSPLAPSNKSATKRTNCGTWASWVHGHRGQRSVTYAISLTQSRPGGLAVCILCYGRRH